MSSTIASGPEIIHSLADGVFAAMAMLAGMKLDVFTQLNNGPLTTQEIADEIEVPLRQLGPLLYALVEWGLLLVENGRFSNTGEAARFLVKGSPGYVGDIHQTWSRRWADLVKLADSIKSDSPQERIDFSTMSPQELENLYSGSYAAARAAGKGLTERFDLTTYRRLVDVAVGSGGDLLQ